MDEAMKERMKQAYDRFYRRGGPFPHNIHLGGNDDEWRRKVFEEILREAQESMKRAQYKSYRSQKSDNDSFEAWFGSFGDSRFQGYTRGYFYEQAKREQQRRRRQEDSSQVFSAPQGNMYEKLGLPVGATMEQVKEAYRKAARLWHPDTYEGNDPKLAAARFREVNEAYEYLKDPTRKESYDHNMRK